MKYSQVASYHTVDTSATSATSRCGRNLLPAGCRWLYLLVSGAPGPSRVMALRDVHPEVLKSNTINYHNGDVDEPGFSGKLFVTGTI